MSDLLPINRLRFTILFEVVFAWHRGGKGAHKFRLGFSVTPPTNTRASHTHHNYATIAQSSVSAPLHILVNMSFQWSNTERRSYWAQKAWWRDVRCRLPSH